MPGAAPKYDRAAGAPRVLVLSGEIPQTRNAGGIVLWRLFSGYVACEPKPRAETGSSQMLKGAKAESLKKEQARLFVIGPKPPPEAEVLDCPYRELRMPLARLEKTRFSMHKRSLAALGLIPLPSHGQVLGLLGGFDPQVIVCAMANTPWILTAERTARKLGIPLVLIVHDINEEFERVFPWAKRALFDKNCFAYRAAARRLCVSPEMVEFLEERYGVPGEVMYPNRSEELQPRPLEMSLALRGEGDRPSGSENLRVGEGLETEDGRQETGERVQRHVDAPHATSHSLQASAALTLGYAGSLAYGYGEALVALIPVLREVGARIHISTPKPPEKLKALLEATDVVEWMPHRADVNEMWRTMQERADVVILPYLNPAGPHELLYRTHFPSKLTEYLALGMPVVVSGPEFATGLRYAQAEKRETEKSENLKSGNAEREAGKSRESGQLKSSDFAYGLSPQASAQSFSVSDFLNFAPNGAVPCTSRDELVACLSRLKGDGELRRQLARRAVDAGLWDFDPREIKARFHQVLKVVCA